MREDLDRKKNTKPSYYLHTGNGGPWRCGYCEHVNFDLRMICLKCERGIRPPFQPGLPWPCLNPDCEYVINSSDRDTCCRCGAKKWAPEI